MTGVSGSRADGLPPVRRSRTRTWLTAATMVTVAATLPAIGITAFSATAASGATPERIGHAPVIPHGVTSIGGTNGGTKLNLDVELAPRNQAALQAFAAAVSDPHSAQYKHYLAKGQFAAVFGPTKATISAVTAELKADGLHPGAVSADGLTIPVSTTVAQAGSALGTGFVNYRANDGRVVYANTAAPELPSSVASMVTGIVGLDDIVKPHSQLGPVKTVATIKPSLLRKHTTVSPHAQGPQDCAGLTGGLDAANLVNTQNYWSPQALATSTAFNTDGLYNGYGNTGAGVTVAVFELENFDPTDVANYEACEGGNVPVSTIRVDGGPTTPVDQNNSAVGLESALDMETIAAMAPGVSSILDYEGPDTNTTDGNVLDTYQQIVTDDRAQVISTSWGACELALSQDDPGFLSAEGSIFAEAATQGQSVLAASGDDGAEDCAPLGGTLESQLSVDDPADQPFVTGVGGLSMTNNPPTVTVWNEPDTDFSPAGSGGGGLSTTQVLSGSADYQAGMEGPGYSNVCSAPTGAQCRQVPDVSALADGNQGYVVTFGTDPTSGAPELAIVGGTSGAAPLVASITALADGSTSCAANGPAGFLNPELYQSTGVFNDVVNGNNSFAPAGPTSSLYSAGTGYDMASGLGWPKAPAMVEAICGAVTASPGSTYVALPPTRILDTRSKIGVGTTTPVGPGGTVNLQVTGTAGVPSTNVTAVVLNVTAVTPTSNGFLTVFPAGTQRPASSNLNFTTNETIPNLVTVPVGPTGGVSFFNSAGNTHVLADLQGYYTTSSTGSLYNALTPVRLLDTRNAIGVSTTTPIGAGGTLPLQIEGNSGVPASGVTAVVLNVTATQPSGSSFLTVFPDGGTQPGVSNLNFTANETIPNLVTVAVGSDGKVDFFNHVGTVHVLADLAGYYTNTGTGLKFHASPPHRLLDTRNGDGVAAGQPAPVGQGQTESFPLSDPNGPGNAGPLTNAGALVLNVTVTAPTASSFVTVFPSSAGLPGVSNLNFTAGETIPNAVVTQVKGGAINFFNHAGSVQLVTDIFGYFSTS